MTDRIIEIGETAARLYIRNELLNIETPEHQAVTVPVGEIQCLILANPALTVSGAVLASLAANGAVIVVSGSNRLPVAMSLPLDGNYVQNERFRAQVSAGLPLCKRLWQTIVKAKIGNQGRLLEEFAGSDFALGALAAKVASGDPQNVEGRAAVIYWKNLFPDPFARNREAPDNNLLLNYGYAILRAMTARACCAAGLHPTLGVNHHNRYDSYCLADDLMEPYRVIVDRCVREMNPENAPVPELTRKHRSALLTALLTARIRRKRGSWLLSDDLKHTANLLAESYQTGENVLDFF